MGGNAIEQFLMQRQLDERKQVEEEFRRRQIEEQSARQQQQLMLDAEQQRMAAAEQQRRADREATAARQETNQAGVRGMIGEAISQPITPDSARTISGMAYGEGLAVPGIVAQALAPPPKDELAEYESKKRIDAKYRPPTEGSSQQDWVIRNGKPTPIPRGTARPGDAPYDSVSARMNQGNAGGAGNDYASRGSRRLTDALNNVEAQISDQTVGTWRAMGARAMSGYTPGSVNPTIDFDALVEQTKALIGFDELSSMRRASPTGGALGNITERELSYLQSVAGSLNPNQSQAQFRQQLANIRAEVQRVVDHGLGGGNAAPIAPAASHGAPAGPRRVGRFEIVSEN
jgi:hypothetical protein